MSTSKISRAIHTVFRQISRMAHSLGKGLVSWLLRGLLILGRQPFASIAGFVLPTTVLLLLVVTLTVGAIGYRTYTRSQQAIGERQQRVIYNAATPAIDRAKAKIEFMFNARRDPRFGGVPSEDQLIGMMLNDGSQGVPRYPTNPTAPDPYTFPGETRINIGGIGGNAARKDNAWRYRTDLDGDGTDDATVVYSILFEAPDVNLAAERPLTLRDSTDATVRNRATRLMIRNAPLSNAAQVNSTCVRGDTGGSGIPLISERGWFDDPVDSTRLRKNFQVNAFVQPDNGNTIATLEFQQDREAIQGFKWAAWFRNDLEVFPGPQFNWNGAMHTEGSYFMSGNFRAYMVSSPSSCLYKEDASTLTNPSTISTDPNIPNFQGQFVAGTLRDNDFDGSPKFDLWQGEGQRPRENVTMNSTTDSLTSSGNQGPLDISLDPVRLQTEDVSAGRRVANPGTRRDDPRWTNANPNLAGRMQNLAMPTPYLDDTFRADNRYGPKPRFGYDRRPIPGQIGGLITGNLELIGEDPRPGQDPNDLGLDGYWERRAQKEGVRIIVGQRLELGDPAGWGGPTLDNRQNREEVASLANEPLRPWAETCIGNSCNQMRQRKMNWDNLASVQATAVYHSSPRNTTGRAYPAACMVTTVHPGTATTLDRSATFEDLAFGFSGDGFAAPYNAPGTVITDFFRGRGTNGWEFSIPAESEFRNTNSNLIKGLRNLAYFAGDPSGGAPSFTPVQDTFVHPYPSMSMWGDFSMLRRVLNRMDTGTLYDELSPADKTTLHTAACTMGMLAYNVDYLEKFNLNSVNANLIGVPNAAHSTTATDPYWQGLRGHIRAIDALIWDPDRNNNNTSNANDTGDLQVPLALRNSIPGEIKNLVSSDMDFMAWIQGSRSLYSSDPETYVRLLEFWRDTLADTDALKPQLSQEINLARMIITQQQVARDREFGFRGSYAWTGRDNALADQCKIWYDAATGTDRQDSFKTGAQKEPLMRLCSDRPRYPALYSLFPLVQHGDVTGTADEAERVRDSQDNVGRNRNYLRLANNGLNYTPVTPASVRVLPLRLDSTTGLGFNDTSLTGGRTGWRIPTLAFAAGSIPNSNEFDLIKVCPAGTTGTSWQDVVCSRQTAVNNRLPVSGNRYRIAFKDAAFMNGRELLSVRTLDLDLDLMRRTAAFGDDYWLPKSGIIYAFREDAVSEAHIVRPATGTWASCGNEESLRTDARCQIKTGDRVGAEDSEDPPLSPLAITPKAVDYFPDPDRRPYGFRLRNGAALWRGTISGGEIQDDSSPAGRGLSFITDNPAYIQGPFNLHRSPNQPSLARADGLEEFTQKLNTADFDNDGAGTFAFYNRTDLNLDFSDPKKDQWRPTELIADAVTPLSPNFCDGSVEDGIRTTSNDDNLSPNTLVGTRYGCVSTRTTEPRVTSYLNQNRRNPDTGNAIGFVRSNIVDTFWRSQVSGSGTRAPDGNGEGASSPIFIYRSGRPMRLNTSGNLSEFGGNYELMNEDKPRVQAASGVQMNLIMVSGVVPSREGQSYGGLHNFPRFIEDWGSQEFFISGAFLQLNFSTYATAPFDQEQWEPGLSAPNRGANNNEWIEYYSPPNRRWGFDVGLKYAPPGPVAQRFRTPDPARSEFYSEPATDDPYIQNLSSCVGSNSCLGS